MAILPNPLEQFSTMNCLISLAVLSPAQINSPSSTYRRDPNNLYYVVQNGGGIAGKKRRTAYEQALGADVEFFIDDLEVETLINAAKSTTNATKFSFTVHEPYSMGLFLQSLQVSSVAAGYTNYVAAPMLLTVRFVGYNADGQYISADRSTRMFAIRLTDARFSVTEGGSVYNVEAIAWNDSAFYDQIQQLKHDVRISGTPATVQRAAGISGATASAGPAVSTTGTTVSSLLTELAEKINLRMDNATDESVDSTAVQAPIPDRIVFAFPQPGDSIELSAGVSSQQASLSVRSQSLHEAVKSAAAAVSNTIMTSKVHTLAHQTGTYHIDNGTVKYSDTAAALYNRSSITYSVDKGALAFKAGVRIQDIITDIIIASGYGQSLQRRVKNPPADNMVDWFRIESQVFVVSNTNTEESLGKSPQVVVYKIIPYKVHVSTFKKDVGTYSKSLQEQVSKKYNYLYTGKNQDVLAFELQFNYQYFTPITADNNSSTSKQALGEQNTTVNKEETPTVSVISKPISGPAPVSAFVLGNSAPNSVAYESPESNVARMFHNSFVSGVDLMHASLTIKGDPYYLVDSGVGNYTAAGQKMVTDDYTMFVSNGQIFVEVVFRNPIDYADNGIMTFYDDVKTANGSKIVNEFSGLYRVIRVTNKLANNRFEQVLELLRQPQQDTTSTAIKPA